MQPDVQNLDPQSIRELHSNTRMPEQIHTTQLFPASCHNTADLLYCVCIVPPSRAPRCVLLPCCIVAALSALTWRLASVQNPAEPCAGAASSVFRWAGLHANCAGDATLPAAELSPPLLVLVLSFRRSQASHLPGL
mmetsp:Transcript_15811/g.47610  ORF Transcript_15811/g.47610 Transcript_15811/m.47610 type:complete len:136 (+) Transcript_15811:232-639(+)